MCHWIFSSTLSSMLSRDCCKDLIKFCLQSHLNFKGKFLEFHLVVKSFDFLGLGFQLGFGALAGFVGGRVCFMAVASVNVISAGFTILDFGGRLSSCCFVGVAVS